MSGLLKKPKAPKQPELTPQQQALSRRQDDALSREIEEENRRKKALLRDTLGNVSLLSGLTGPASGGADFTQFAGGTSGKSLITPSRPAATPKAQPRSDPRRPRGIPF